jgi:DNA-binding response OmpR family regulator
MGNDKNNNKIQLITPAIRIFILEDTQAMLDQIYADLQALGVTKNLLSHATSIKEALTKIPAFKPQFIISDINLPDGKGMALVKAIRKEKKFDDVPIMMLTTESEVKFILEAISLGAQEFCTKPWELKVLAEKMNYAWEKIHKKNIAA